MENREFILISVPAAAGGQNEFARLKRHCCQEADLCVAYRFALPALRIGTLDALMSLCDDLSRIDSHVEAVCRRVRPTPFRPLALPRSRVCRTYLSLFVSLFRTACRVAAIAARGARRRRAGRPRTHSARQYVFYFRFCALLCSLAVGCVRVIDTHFFVFVAQALSDSAVHGSSHAVVSEH